MTVEVGRRPLSPVKQPSLCHHDHTNCCLAGAVPCDPTECAQIEHAVSVTCTNATDQVPTACVSGYYIDGNQCKRK